MSSGLGPVIQLGNDILSDKYYALATTPVLFYDYLLTLEDEVKYVWSKRKSWVFWLFIFIRYSPMTWQLWQLGVEYSPPSQLDTKVCGRTAWYGLLVFVICTLLAHVMLTIRIYAVTGKNALVTAGFIVIAACQLVLGVWMVTLAVMKGAEPQPQVPLDAYHLCMFDQHRGIEVAYTGISLFFDFLTFSLSIFFTKLSRTPGLNIPTIFDTIAEDATLYFFIIFTSHLILIMTLNLGRPTIQLLPGPGVLVFTTATISRITLSLRKAGESLQDVWSRTGPPTHDASLQSMEFSCPEVQSWGETTHHVTHSLTRDDDPAEVKISRQ